MNTCEATLFIAGIAALTMGHPAHPGNLITEGLADPEITAPACPGTIVAWFGKPFCWRAGGFDGFPDDDKPRISEPVITEPPREEEPEENHEQC